MLTQAMRYAVLRRRTCGGAQWQLLAMAVAWVLGPIHTAQGVTIRVPQEQPTIAAAISQVNNGTANDTVILLAPGVYTEPVSLIGRTFTLRGTQTQTERTIMRATPDLGGNAQVVIFASTNIRFGNDRIHEYVIENIDFVPDPATVSGQIVHAWSQNLRFVNCRFLNHRANNSVTGSTVEVQQGSLILDRCEFIGNLVAGTLVEHNTDTPAGQSGDLIIQNCRFEGNHPAANYSSGVLIASYGRSARISDSIFVRNGTSLNHTMVIGNFHGYGKHMVNVTIADNYGSGGILGYYAFGLPADEPNTIVNSIIWNNRTRNPSSPGIGSATAAIAISYSVVQQGYPGMNNINVDPLFVDAASGDYRLQPSSPCIDAGNNTAVEIGDAMDLAGSLRFADVAAVANTGVPSTAFPRAIVDLGSYEFVPSAICSADTDHSGSVTAEDLFAYLDQWFAQMGAACP